MDLVWKEDETTTDEETRWTLWDRDAKPARRHAAIVTGTTRDEKGNWVRLTMIGHPVPEGAATDFDDLDVAKNAGLNYASA